MGISTQALFACMPKSHGLVFVLPSNSLSGPHMGPWSSKACSAIFCQERHCDCECFSHTDWPWAGGVSDSSRLERQERRFPKPEVMGSMDWGVPKDPLCAWSRDLALLV